MAYVGVALMGVVSTERRTTVIAMMMISAGRSGEPQPNVCPPLLQLDQICWATFILLCPLPLLIGLKVCCCHSYIVAMVTADRCHGYRLEREESVKADIFQAYRTLLQVTKSSVGVSDNDSMETGDR